MNSYPIPDFIVVGAQVDGEVVLMASKSLTETELHEELRDYDWLYKWDIPRSHPEYDMSITVHVKDYVMVTGKDYAEAWQTLFKTWSPRREELPGLRMLP